MVNNYLKRVVCLLLLSMLYACSTDDSIVSPPDGFSYYLRTTESLTLDRGSFVERLGADASNSMVAVLPDNRVKVEAILYKSVAPDGKEVEASGIIAYPESGEFKGVIMGEHFTIAANREAPSSTMATFEAALSLYGYLVIVPDLIGFGSTVELTHPYIHAESSGQVSVDMYFAAREYFAAQNKPISEEVLAIGYSQGAYSAMAFAKMVQEKYEDELSVASILVGGGPYVPQAMFDVFVADDYADYPCSLPMTILGLNYGGALGLDYTEVFLEPLLSNYNEWFNSKRYTTGQLDRLIGSNTPSDFLHPSFLTPQSAGKTHALYQALADNSLINWKPKADVYLVHGQRDLSVPFINAELAHEAFTRQGTKVTLVPVNAGHTDTAVSFYILLLSRLGLL